MKLIFLGPPGAGKGTQAKLLAEFLEIPHISTGEIFRYNIKNKTELGVKAQGFIDQGHLVPNDVTNAMVDDRLKQDDCKKGFILDGYPRNLNQSNFLQNIINIDRAVYFDLSDTESISRMMFRAKDSGRSDDNEEIIKERIKVYKKET